jgi:hypothetical protein
VCSDLGHIDRFAGQHVHAVLQLFIQVGSEVLEGAEFVLFDALHDVGAQHVKLQGHLRQQDQPAERHDTEGQLDPDTEVFHGSTRAEGAAGLFAAAAVQCVERLKSSILYYRLIIFRKFNKVCCS